MCFFMASFGPLLALFLPSLANFGFAFIPVLCQQVPGARLWLGYHGDLAAEEILASMCLSPSKSQVEKCVRNSALYVYYC